MRLLTAIAMIGICGFAAARGWGIVHFSADYGEYRFVGKAARDHKHMDLHTIRCLCGLAS